MYVVVVGSREWRGPEATKQVTDLLEELRQKYSGLVVVTSSTDKGVGAMVRCKHAAKAGETLQVIRADTGEKSLARVAWQRPSGDDDIRIGVEFVACENFWGLDWGAVEEAQ